MRGDVGKETPPKKRWIQTYFYYVKHDTFCISKSSFTSKLGVPQEWFNDLEFNKLDKKISRETPIFHKYIFRRKKKIGEEKKDKTHNNDTNHIQVIDRQINRKKCKLRKVDKINRFKGRLQEIPRLNC